MAPAKRFALAGLVCIVGKAEPLNYNTLGQYAMQVVFVLCSAHGFRSYRHESTLAGREAPNNGFSSSIDTVEWDLQFCLVLGLSISA